MENVSFGFQENADGLLLTHSQDIPASWADWLAEKRREAWELRNRTEYVHVASIPAIFVTKWLQEGFNVYLEEARDIEKRLHAENLTGFLATEKRAF